jgi:hypothetical protein
MLDDNGSFVPSIVDNLLAWSLKSLLDDFHSVLLIEVFHLDIV